MYDRTPTTALEWMRAVPGYIPDQAVMFENINHTDNMFVARVNVGYFVAGSFVSSGACAEYYLYGTNCAATFDILVLKYGEPPITTYNSI